MPISHITGLFRETFFYYKERMSNSNILQITKIVPDAINMGTMFTGMK